MLWDNQHAHDCRVEAGVAVFNMLMIVDWADLIDQSNKKITENEHENSSQRKLSQKNWALKSKLMLLNSWHAQEDRLSWCCKIVNMLTIVK